MTEPMSSRALQLLPDPIPFSVCSFDAASIHYDFYDAPSRSAVLVVPGFWRDRRYPSMLRLASFLTGAGYRAAICDLRGDGESGGCFGFNRSEHYDAAAVVADLIRRCGIERVTLV